MSELEPTRTYSNHTATEVLRRLLDERGVEHYDGTESTLWGYELTSDSTGAYRYSADETSDGYIQVQLWHVTPEQAIAATLGATDAKPTQVESSGTCKLTMDGTDGCFGCSECLENIPPLANFCPNCGRRIVEPTTNDVDVEVGAMSITDELRGWKGNINTRLQPETVLALRSELNCIADRIDAAVEGMVELPKDADNVPWHVGDRDEDGNVVTELRLTYDGCWFVITDGEWPYRPKRKRHHHDHHAPTVEDVLCDILNEYRENECTLEEARLTEYATRLRLEDYGGR